MLLVIHATTAHGQVPQQAQASNLVVPEPKHIEPPHKPFPFASGVVVSECKLVKAVLLVDKKGITHPQRFQDMAYSDLLKLLREAAPADRIVEVTLACPDARSV